MARLADLIILARIRFAVRGKRQDESSRDVPPTTSDLSNWSQGQGTGKLMGEASLAHRQRHPGMCILYRGYDNDPVFQPGRLDPRTSNNLSPLILARCAIPDCSSSGVAHGPLCREQL